MDRDSALEILRKNNVQENVIEHCTAVSELAVEIAKKIKARKHNIDINFIETAALLHDIGRSRTHGIRHGIEGAEIMKDHPLHARVCERHLGGGIAKEEAVELGLPGRDYLPETLEEKVICYADKLIDGNRRVTIEETIGKFRRRLGPRHQTIQRIKRLDEEIRGLID